MQNSFSSSISTNSNLETETPTSNSNKNAKNLPSKIEKKRFYREEWKIVLDNEKATEGRLENLIINPRDSWGMWCKACTGFASQYGNEILHKFCKRSAQF